MSVALVVYRAAAAEIDTFPSLLPSPHSSLHTDEREVCFLLFRMVLRGEEKVVLILSRTDVNRVTESTCLLQKENKPLALGRWWREEITVSMPFLPWQR